MHIDHQIDRRQLIWHQPDVGEDGTGALGQQGGPESCVVDRLDEKRRGVRPRVPPISRTGSLCQLSTTFSIG